MTQVVEIRTYTLKAGMAEQFHHIMQQQSVPLLRAAGTDVVAARPSLHAKDSYLLMRAYPGLEQRSQSQEGFYASAAWLNGPREAVMACIDTYTTSVIAAHDALIDHLREAPTGAPGDFDFLSGNWKIAHRQLKDGQWDLYEGEATVHGLLGGLASVEELRIPSRNFSGMGLRLLDVEKGLWADYWANGKGCVLSAAPAWGGFTNGVGRWDSDAVDSGKPVKVRGVWDSITPDACRWYQAVSRDGGQTWEENWIMHWQRVTTA
ncbi:MAG: hypothetical protein V4484_07745 [Pseudomonadota bacterium]